MLKAMNNLEIFASPAALVEAVTQKLVQTSRDCILKKRRFTLALSGGSTPKALYENMASAAWRDRFDWANIEIFFGDDRAVGPDDEFSNYKMAKSAFGGVPAKLHRIEGELEPEIAAQKYNALLEGLGSPIDVVLLGLGDDGHTASLFPDSPVLGETQILVSATPVATLQPFVRRVTMTFPAINASANKWFLVTGNAKAARLNEVLNGPKNVQKLPAQGVENPVWFVDEGAASGL